MICYRPSIAGRGRFQHEYVILDFAADLTPVNPDDRMARNLRAVARGRALEI